MTEFAAEMNKQDLIATLSRDELLNVVVAALIADMEQMNKRVAKLEALLLYAGPPDGHPAALATSD